MMAVKLHRRQLLLLSLVLLSVVSLPTCMSIVTFRPSRNIPVLREARRSAYTGEPDGWRIMDPEHRLAKEIVKSAAKQANVTAAQVLEAFYKKRCRQNTKESMLVLLENRELDSEVRINAYLAAMQCADDQTLVRIQSILESEENSQVGSFIWAHVTNLQQTASPAKASIRAILENIQLQKQFDHHHHHHNSLIQVGRRNSVQNRDDSKIGKSKKKTTCLLFNAWSEHCISQLMHCVALSNGCNDIDVDCYYVYAREAISKQAGQVYMSREQDGPIVSINAFNFDAPKQFLVMPCFAIDRVPMDLQQSCITVIDPDRPYIVVRRSPSNNRLHYDLDYRPRNPETFDNDASFYVRENKFFPGYDALESVSYPGHYMRVTSHGWILISDFQETAEFRSAASFAFPNRGIWKRYPCSSCKEIQNLVYYAPSGEYSIKTSRGQTLEKVYCEMGLNDGGYMFLNPKDWPTLTNDEVQAMFTDKTSFLIRSRCNDSTQPYGVLKQLPKYKHIPLKLGLNEFSGYSAPNNVDFVGGTFMYAGFVPASLASIDNEQGFQVNGVNVTVTDVNGTPNSYIALFPNFRELPPADFDGHPGLLNSRGLLSAIPSGRVMPEEYFMFLESQFGAGGWYVQTDITVTGTSGAAIGFR